MLWKGHHPGSICCLQRRTPVPWSFRVVCVCACLSMVRAAVFSSETEDWVIHPWTEIGGGIYLNDSGFTLVGGSFYRSLYGKGRAVRINTATMDVSNVYLPSQAIGYIGDTEDGKLCMVYATEDFLLLVWIRSGDGDGIDSWVLQDIIRLRAEMDQFTTTPWQWEGQVEVVQVRFGCVYLCMTSITAAGTQRSSFFYLSLETMEIELLIHGTSGDSAYPYIMAWPPCLVGDDRRTEHEVEGSCSCLLK
uniref:F-box protein AT5G49610-like beta-propeller domain-containing protein n=1 Tax=Triticum urartu TaxID=4572 RepID=A0A8R7RDX4_TRIUA